MKLNETGLIYGPYTTQTPRPQTMCAIVCLSIRVVFSLLLFQSGLLAESERERERESERENFVSIFAGIVPDGGPSRRR